MKILQKTGLILVALGIMISIQSCGEENIQETHFTGVWKINRYNVSGTDLTSGYLKEHKDYSIFVKPGNVFSETWIEKNETRYISGKWDILDGGKNIVLKDPQHGERIYDLNYMFTLKHKAGNEEIILRKI